LPDSDDLARVYPARAAQRGIGGEAVLHCQMGGDGRLVGCTAEEAPEGSGFGRAALALVPVFRIQLPTRDGKPVSGVAITVPVRFLRPN